MGDALTAPVVYAIGVAISPIPIIGVLVMLMSDRGRANGLAFLAGWVVALSAVGAALLAFAHGGEEQGGSTASGIVSLVLGLLLLALASRTWRKRPRAGEEASPPQWITASASFEPRRALQAGLALAGVNPKNFVLAAGAASAIASAAANAREAAAGLAVFVAIATLGPLIPVLLYVIAGDRARDALGEARHWLARHNAVIMVALLAIIGAKLLADGVSTLS